VCVKHLKGNRELKTRAALCNCKQLACLANPLPFLGGKERQGADLLARRPANHDHRVALQRAQLTADSRNGVDFNQLAKTLT
jgi:hypothetical protein